MCGPHEDSDTILAQQSILVGHSCFNEILID